MDTNGRLSNIHPGEVWGEEFLIPLGLSQYVLDKAMAYQRCGSARFVPANGRSLRQCTTCFIILLIRNRISAATLKCYLLPSEPGKLNNIIV